MVARAAMPGVYARAKLPTLLERWRGAAGDAVRALGPRVFGATPAEALLGLTASSMGPAEAVGDLTTSGSAAGLYGVEGPALRQLGPSQAVRDLLGRSVATDPHSTAWRSDIEGQTAVGLLNYARHLGAVDRALPAALRSAVGNVWALRLAAGGYSVGDGGTAGVIAHYAGELAALAPDARWDRLRARVAHDAATSARIGPLRARGRYGAAFLCVRIDQRVEAGRQLAEAVGDDTAWFGAVSPDDLAIANLAYDGQAPHETTPPPPSADGMGLGAAAVLAGLLWGAWKVLR